MEIAPITRRRTGESFVPMINVVFLLLIFFLMTSRVVPPEPFRVAPPETSHAHQTPNGQQILYLSADGIAAFQDQRGAAAILAAAGATQIQAPNGDETSPAPLIVKTDAQTPAQDLAQILRQLAQNGVAQVEITVSRR